MTNPELARQAAETWARSCGHPIPTRFQIEQMSKQFLSAIETATDERDKEIERLQAFKDWCHAYLDGKGIPHHPSGTHGAEGCRIGDRMDYVYAERDAIERQSEEQRSYSQQLRVEMEAIKRELATEKDAHNQMEQVANQLHKEIERLKADLVKYDAALIERHTLRAQLDAAKEAMRLMHSASLGSGTTKESADKSREAYLAYRKVMSSTTTP